VPRPVSATAEAGDGFTLSEESTIRASEELEGLATTLADLLEPATGFDVEITSGEAGAGDIRLELVADEAADPESYELMVDDRVRIAAPTPHGLFNGIQTLRQLLPAWIESPNPVEADWHVPAVMIRDEPRFEYRG